MLLCLSANSCRLSKLDHISRAAWRWATCMQWLCYLRWSFFLILHLSHCLFKEHNRPPPSIWLVLWGCMVSNTICKGWPDDSSLGLLYDDMLRPFSQFSFRTIHFLVLNCESSSYAIKDHIAVTIPQSSKDQTWFLDTFTSDNTLTHWFVC